MSEGRKLLLLLATPIVAVLVFANWGEPAGEAGFWAFVWSHKWLATAGAGLALALVLVAWFGLGHGLRHGLRHLDLARASLATVGQLSSPSNLASLSSS